MRPLALLRLQCIGQPLRTVAASTRLLNRFLSLPGDGPQPFVELLERVQRVYHKLSVRLVVVEPGPGGPALISLAVGGIVVSGKMVPSRINLNDRAVFIQNGNLSGERIKCGPQEALRIQQTGLRCRAPGGRAFAIVFIHAKM